MHISLDLQVGFCGIQLLGDDCICLPTNQAGSLFIDRLPTRRSTAESHGARSLWKDTKSVGSLTHRCATPSEMSWYARLLPDTHRIGEGGVGVQQYIVALNRKNKPPGRGAIPSPS